MALHASLAKARSDLADAASRNLQHSRPSSTAPARTSTPKPTFDPKRTHDAAFSHTQPDLPTVANNAGNELMTQVIVAISYLKDKDRKPVPFDTIIGYLSLPNDARKTIPLIKRALLQNPRAEFIPASQTDTGKESFRFRPLHPVGSAEELKNYLAAQPTMKGLPVNGQSGLKESWADCLPAIDDLERAGSLLAQRKKDNTPRLLWSDNPIYHIINPNTSLPKKIDADFADVWNRTKLPASDAEIRNELEKAGLTPTSAVREVKRVEARKKEKKRGMRKGGKTTNQHMLGILKDYSSSRK